jgi:hypothetical protein
MPLPELRRMVRIRISSDPVVTVELQPLASWSGLATLTVCLLVYMRARRWLAVIGRAASPSETARVNIIPQVRDEVKLAENKIA